MQHQLARHIALALGTALVVAACGTHVDEKPTDAATDASAEETVATLPERDRLLDSNAQLDQTLDLDVPESRQNRVANEAEIAAAAPAADMSLVRKQSGVPFGIVAPEDRPNRHAWHQNRENYAHIVSNPVKRVSEDPVSTLSIDVDTGSYANVRRYLDNGQLPPRDAVRVEELVNYFDYAFEAPQSTDVPFAVTTEVGPNPWNDDTLLFQVGVQGYEVAEDAMPPANLVFLVDVSGSMQSPDKLELLKSSLKLLTQRLDKDDRVSIVVYAGAAGLVLPPTAGNETSTIAAALSRLTAGGSTNGGAGIELAYATAQQAFIEDGINRVILATDGDFNVGTVNFESLKNLAEEKRKTGIALTTLGFGTGNYNDHLMEQLADHGNGNYAYIDSINEARKVLVDQVTSTLNIIAKDVKIQIEFNPTQVAEYRLIGYENRLLNREDFNNDKVDAGEIGAGHTLTALYEIALTDGKGHRIEPLRYGTRTVAEAADLSGELAHLRLRYKEPDADRSQLLEYPVQRAAIESDLAQTSDNFRFASAVAAFGQRLRGGDYLQTLDTESLIDLANGARGDDRYGYRGEFVGLVRTAAALQPEAQPALAAGS